MAVPVLNPVVCVRVLILNVHMYLLLVIFLKQCGISISTLKYLRVLIREHALSICFVNSHCAGCSGDNRTQSHTQYIYHMYTFKDNTNIVLTVLAKRGSSSN